MVIELFQLSSIILHFLPSYEIIKYLANAVEPRLSERVNAQLLLSELRSSIIS